MRCNRQIDAYSVETSKGEYIVTVERLKNDINGRAEYYVIPIGSDLRYKPTVLLNERRNEYDS